MLDAPEAAIRDPELAAALARRGRRITLVTLLVTALATAVLFVV